MNVWGRIAAAAALSAVTAIGLGWALLKLLIAGDGGLWDEP